MALVATCVYAAFAGPRLKGPSTDPHFLYQAEAFLQGSLELRRPPPHRNDWASYHELELASGETLRGVYTSSGRGGQLRRFRTLRGRTLLIEPSEVRRRSRHTFVSFPSFPAVLLMPFVAVLGTGVSDVWFTVLVAGLNVGLLFLFLELLTHRGHSLRSRRENLGLALVFAFGTVHFWCSVLGQVWFTALVVGVALHSLYLLAALDARHPWLAGLCLGLGMATRTPLAFASVFFAWQVLGPPAAGEPWGQRLRQLARFAAPVVAVGLTLMALNVARFGRPFEFGHTYLAEGSIDRIRDYGLFGLHFLPRNLAAAFVLLPSLSRSAPYLHLSRHGMSLFLSTPPFATLLLPPRRRVPLRRALVLAAACVALPLLLYQNTGHIQYGYRFSLDLTPLLFGLSALSDRRLGRWFWALALLGVAVNAFGAITFQRFDLLYDDHFPELSW